MDRMTVESLKDLWMAEQGLASADQVRRAIIADALVDAGAIMLALPKRIIRQLELKKAYEKQAHSSRGLGTVGVHEPVRLAIQGRSCVIEVDEVPALIGQVPLELMGWVVDPCNQRLIGNPEHGGEQILELY